MTGRQRTTAWLVGVAVAGGIVALAVVPGGSSGGPSTSGALATGESSSGGSLPTTSAGAPAAGGSATTSTRGASPSAGVNAVDADLTATRVVRTGQLSLVVPAVTTAVSRLTALASGAGGYVQSSSTTSIGGVPEGEVTLRVPVAGFDAAVAGAQRLGRTQSLTTSTADVTGRYVDLVAQAATLRRTRSTYLSILSGARTIGATLAVEQRVDDVQQQLDRVEGERKVLAAQSDDATLAVSLSQRHGAVVPARPVRSGLDAAWHRSVHRFSVGVDAIVGALGPLLLALVLLAILAGVGLLGYRGVRRVVS